MLKKTGITEVEIKKILNGIIEAKIVEYTKKTDNEQFNGTEMKSKNQETIKYIAALHKLALGADVTIKEVENKKKKTETVLQINCPKLIEKRVITEEEIRTWQCHRCLRVNSESNYCDSCGMYKDDRVATEKRDLPKMTEQQKALCNELYQKFEQKMDNFNLRDFKDYSVDLGYDGYQAIKTELEAISDFNQYQQKIRNLTAQLYQKANEQAIKDGNAVEQIPAELAQDNSYQAQILDTSKK